MNTRIIDSLMAARNEKVAIDALPDMPAVVEAACAVQGELVARIGPGDVIVADFGALGNIEVTFE
jgi:2-keto-4-pentenoate hydratase